MTHATSSRSAPYTLPTSEVLAGVAGALVAILLIALTANTPPAPDQQPDWHGNVVRSSR